MKPPRILVVDDEPDVESLITQKFRRKVRNGEMELMFARDGLHALEVLEEASNIDIVLSDINMPRMDGLTLLERLKEMETDLKTVIVSAYGDMGNIRVAMNRGAFDFITKPIEFADLEKTIAKTLMAIDEFREMRSAKENAEHAHMLLSRYFSPNVVQTLSKDPDAMHLSGERRQATFLFTDLADFTPLVEASSSDAIVTVLNEYLDGLTEIIFDHGGTVMKIVGDAVHAIFGAPVPSDDHASAAVDCALALDLFARRFQEKMDAEGIQLGITRIGVNTGSAIIGNFGGKRYFDYTAYGDAVNVGSRLESANKVVGTHICVSENVIREIPDFLGRPIGTLLLKGKSQAIRCFEPLTPEKASSEAVESYCKAFAQLEANNPKARQSFAALVGQFDEDALIMYHLGRLMRGETGVEIDLDIA